VPPDPARVELVDQASFGAGGRGLSKHFLCCCSAINKNRPPGAPDLGPARCSPVNPPLYTPDKQISSWGPFPEQVMGAYEGRRMPILLGPDGLPQKEDI
jgi:hypothetical protein